MTCDSLDDLEDRVDALDVDGDTVREWAEQYVERQIAEHGFDVVWSAEDADDGTITLHHPVLTPDAVGGRIPIREFRDGFTFYAPPAAVPEWIDLEDLPVRP